MGKGWAGESCEKVAAKKDEEQSLNYFLPGHMAIFYEKLQFYGSLFPVECLNSMF